MNKTPSYLESGGEGLLPAVCQTVAQWATTYRERLADVFWFMRMLNESIARQARHLRGGHRKDTHFLTPSTVLLR